jgi:biotin carboxyl carrier protein
MPAILLQSLLGFEPHDGRWITGVFVGVDDPRRRMVLSAQSLGEKALGAFSRQKEVDRRIAGVDSPVDPADYHAAVEQAKAQVLAAEAALTQRKQELDRQTALFEKKVNALQEYQDAQDNYDTAQANLAAAKANLLTSELKLSYTKIYASVNGEVTNLNVSQGAYASAGQQVLAPCRLGFVLDCRLLPRNATPPYLHW